MCAARAHRFLPSKVFVLFRSEDRIQTFSTKKGPVLVSVGVLANDNGKVCCSVLHEERLAL
jgi:hypothetical protein